MKLSKELLLQAVNAAFEFNAENNHAVASVNYSKDNLALGLNVFTDSGWAYYKISTTSHADDPIYAKSHEENLKGFLNALKSHTSHV